MNPDLLLNGLRRSFSVIILLLVSTITEVAAQSPNASFTIGQTSGCFPLSVQFNNTSSNATSWYWDFGNGNFSTAQNPVNVFLDQGNYSVKLVAYNAAGQADSVLHQNAISVYAPPAVNFTASASVLCLESGSVAFTNQSLYFDSCLWDFGDGFTSTDLNPVHVYGYPGYYTVTLVAYNTTQGCSASLSKTSYIQILSNPAATFSASTATSCLNQGPVVFQSQASSATSWQWQFGDGGTSTLPNPTHVYNATGTFTVSLVTINQLGCSDTVILNNYITILDNPVPSITSSQPSNSCAPVYQSFSTSVSSVQNYFWDFGDSTSSQAPNGFHIYYNIGNFNVTLNVNYQNGCSNSNSIPITILPKPVVNAYATGTQGCAPFTASFVNLSTGSGNTYLWDFGDGNTSSLHTPTHVYTTPGNYTARLTVTAPGGCQGVSNHMIFNIANVDAQFFADDVSGCVPHTVNFDHPGGGLYTYSWDFGDGGSSGIQSPAHTYTATGNYTVTLTVTDNSNCTNSYTYPVNVSVTDGINNFNPVTPVMACAPFTVNLYDNSPSTSGWDWDFGDGTTSNIQNPVHTYTASGTYNVTLQTQSSGNNCSQFVSPYATYIIHAGEADFDVTQTPCPPYTATFTDQSTNAVAWLWDFGDGTTSTDQHPVHIYAIPGSYNVSLTITTADGCTFTQYHNYAVTFLPLIANATATSADSTLPMTVNFSSNSIGATAWFWDFGDGGTSTQQNPVHIYNVPGPYDITLTISNPGCSFTYNYAGVTIGSGVILPGGGGDSTAVPDPVYSCVPYEMSFSNPVLNTVQWLWDFGDGNTSTLQNPLHIYTDPGVYTVSLITWDAAGQTDTVVQPAPFYLTGSSADFALSYSNNCQGSTVVTQNNSINAISYLWDFGDGTTSNLEEPTHSYATTGVNYIVSLTVTDTMGCTDFMARSYYAAVGSTISASSRRACAGDSIQFSNGSMNFASYSWSFGDSTYSNLPNPLHAYADSGTYQVSLTVTDSAGCSTTWNLPYNIEINKPVAAFTYTDDNLYPCASVHIQFENLSTGADSWMWNFGDGGISSEENPLHVYTVFGYHDVTLTAIAGGCSDSITIPNAVFRPRLHVNFNYTQSTDCLPVTATFADSSGDAVSWLWDFGDGTTSTQQNPVHVYTTVPAGPVILKVTSIRGCVETIAKPNINVLSLAYEVSDSLGCKPFIFEIEDSSLNAMSLVWSFGDGNTFTGTDPYHIYSSPGTYTVSLTATSPSGCVQVRNPVTTVHVTSPQAQFSLNSVVSCAPTIVNFFDSSIDATMWTWNFGDGNYSITDDPVHIYNAPGTYDVTLVVSDSSGCTDTLVRPALVHITGSIAAFTVSGTSGCYPWDVQFQDSSISAFSWIWNFGDGQTSTLQNPVHTYAAPGSYMVTLMTQDTTGCQSVYSNPVPLNVSQPPSAAFNASVNAGCVPLTVNFNNQSLLSNAYLWDFGDGTTSSQANPVHTYQQPGTYYVTLISYNSSGCADTLIDSTPIVAAANPLPSFNVSKNQGCSPFTAVFTNTSANTDSTTTYLWDLGNGNTSTAYSPVMIYTQPGIYTVSLTVTNNNACTKTITLNNLLNVRDGSPPPPVLLKSVSVADTNAIEVTWGNLPNNSLDAYNLYRYNHVDSVYDLIYTDVNPSSTSMNVTSLYTDNGVSTFDSVYTYVVNAVNECGSALPVEGLVPHTSINIDVSDVNSIMRIDWNLYDGCSVGGYSIYRQDNLSGSFNVIATVDQSTSFYLDSSVYCGGWVAYRVLATDLCGEGFTAWSDIEEINAPASLVNQHVDIVRSTVKEDRYVFTEWEPPVMAPHLVTNFELYKKTPGTSYTMIATLPGNVTNYSDYNANVHGMSYQYRIIVNNLCNVEALPGRYGTSILLGTYLDSENRSILNWTPYQNWDSGVDYYVIERKDLNGDWQQVKIVDGNVTNYIDR